MSRLKEWDVCVGDQRKRDGSTTFTVMAETEAAARAIGIKEARRFGQPGAVAWVRKAAPAERQMG